MVFAALTVVLSAACGTPRPTVKEYPPARPATTSLVVSTVPKKTPPTTKLPGAMDPKPVDEQMNGPVLPPEIPPTVYSPYLRRAITPAPALPNPANECHLAVEVRNYYGEDGCGILLETDDGNLLLVGVAPRGEPLEAGTRLSIGYEYMKDYQGSSCSNADTVIRITCKRLLRVNSGLPRPIVCEAYDKPSQWLLDMAKNYSATYITRFPWDDDRYVYLLESPNGQYLFDCRGYLICKPRKNCLGFVKDFRKGVVIYEG
jgi:hypothetical protein